ncbi:hypothetical protein LZ32DRAFT_305175 [Colletotrichum eremochloae]|nr:hypothetical protein LZ32DRAFT_305175 [Colletotrichum eremochloae]
MYQVPVPVSLLTAAGILCCRIHRWAPDPCHACSRSICVLFFLAGTPVRVTPTQSDTHARVPYVVCLTEQQVFKYLWHLGQELLWNKDVDAHAHSYLGIPSYLPTLSMPCAHPIHIQSPCPSLSPSHPTIPSSRQGPILSSSSVVWSTTHNLQPTFHNSPTAPSKHRRRRGAPRNKRAKTFEDISRKRPAPWCWIRCLSHPKSSVCSVPSSSSSSLLLATLVLFPPHIGWRLHIQVWIAFNSLHILLALLYLRP